MGAALLKWASISVFIGFFVLLAHMGYRGYTKDQECKAKGGDIVLEGRGCVKVTPIQ